MRLINLDTAIVSTYAGSTYGDLNGYGEAAKFSQLRDIVVDSQRKILYVCDVTNNKIKKDSKTLVVYYSTQGHTDKIAKEITANLNANIFEIVPENEYSSDDLNYNNKNSRVS